MKNDNGNKLLESRGKSPETVSWYAFCRRNRQTEVAGQALPAAPRACPGVKIDAARTSND